MTVSNNLSGSSASLTEMRLDAAMKIAALKIEIEKYQEIIKSTSDSYVSRTEMRLTAAIKIAALKMELEKYQELAMSANVANTPAIVENTAPLPPAPRPTTEQNDCRCGGATEDVKKTVQTKMSESDWVNQQARKLLGRHRILKKS